MPVFDPGAGTGRMLALDLDLARGRGSGDPAAEVSAQAQAIAGLVARVGGRVVADVSPGGGRHVLVLFSAPLPWRELRDLARAMSLRFPAVDPAPMCSLGGQIAPPGSRHKSGGWRLLTVPLEDARAVVGRPGGPQVWDGLLAEFAAELRLAEPVEPAGAVADGAELDEAGVPWVPRPGGRAPLAAGLDQVARTGRWDRSRYAGRSEARMAVLGAAAAGGWRLADVRSAAASGSWRGLVALYERRSEPGRMGRLLPAEWRKCIGSAAGEKNVRDWPTSNITTRPPAGEPALAAEYGRIWQWATACDVALEDPERVRRWGGHQIAVRLVLAALGQAAMVSGSAVIEFGVRNLALHAAVSSRTVSRVLRILREEPDPLLDWVSPRRLARADRYQLRIPDRYAASVRWRHRRAGRIEAIHPAFLVLGGPAGLAYQALGPAAARGAEVARTARLSPSATSAALRLLAGHGLAERSPDGWQRGPAALDDVADATGAASLHRERAGRYQQDRESWQAWLRQYQARRPVTAAAADGWVSLDDPDEYADLCRRAAAQAAGVRAPPVPV